MINQILVRDTGRSTLRSDRSLTSLILGLAAERGISTEQAARDVEEAYVRAAEVKHGAEYLFWAKLDADGTMSLAQVLQVVEHVVNPCREVALSDLRSNFPDAELGQYVVNAIAPVHPPKIAHWQIPRATEIENVELVVS